MTKTILKISVSLLFMVIIFSLITSTYSTQNEEGPILHINQTSHTFPAVFEGEELSYSFRVFNHGKTNLEIINGQVTDNGNGSTR